MAAFLQLLLFGGLTWIFWRIVRPFFTKSPLDNVPGPSSVSLFSGNLGQLFARHGWDFLDHLNDWYGGVVKLNGFLGGRYLYVFDPAAMHSIVVKDQHLFEETSWFLSSNYLLFGPSLLASHGETHRKQRKLLTPAFSINHLKQMTPVFNAVARNLRDAMAEQVKETPKELDVLGWMGRAALETLGQGGLGYSFDPLVRETSDTFGDAVKAFLPTLFSLHFYRMFLPFVGHLGPPGFRRKVLEIYPNKNVQKMKDLVDTLYSQAVSIFNAKKAALENDDEAVHEQVGEGKDIMSLLLRANVEASEEDRISDEELIAQVNTLVFAATDTTSNALAKTVFLLAERPDVQEKLREEVTAARDGGDLSYDAVSELPFLDAICRETLRVYPPVTTLFRDTLEDAVLPVFKPFPGVNGHMIHEVAVPKGTPIVISLHGYNRNKAIWGEDATEWKPERWLEPLPEAVRETANAGVYSNLLTFLGGSRSCIGFKFSQLEMKVILSTVIESFRFSLPQQEIVWNIANIAYPTVGEEDKARMPLKVELVKPIRA
ncbi:unnamed protein product [Somion occarium]